jgi:glycosyltransferase involved in cell wall biosynthesis
MFLFVTNDKIGSETGGGQVTAHEFEALNQLGPVDVINPAPTNNPFDSEKAIQEIDFSKYKLAHFYAGTFPELTTKLKANGVKITYTVAAHDVDISREEFLGLGSAFDFPHLNDPNLFQKYISCYKNADVVICPSSVAKKTNNKYGINNTKIIPHGHIPVRNKKHPKRFTVGYLGQCGPDKGLRYLLEAWSILNYKDAILNLAGSQTPGLLPLIRHFGKGNINIQGWVKSTEDFYNSCSVYVQPSATEGFGIEVLEAMSSGRPVVVSDGAGASDCVEDCGFVFEKKNTKKLAQMIDNLKNNPNLCEEFGKKAETKAKNYTWEKVKEQYIQLWRSMI